MIKSYSPSEFLDAFAAGSLKEPIIIDGMVKPSDGKDSIMFSAGIGCKGWTQIPTELIEKIDHIKTIVCKDHEHPYVRLHLKEPSDKSEQAIVFAALLRHSRPDERSQITTQPSASSDIQSVASRFSGRPHPRSNRRFRSGPLKQSWCCLINGICTNGTLMSGEGCGVDQVDAINAANEDLEYGCYNNGGVKYTGSPQCS